MKLVFAAVLAVAASVASADDIDDFIAGTGPTNVVTTVRNPKVQAFAYNRGVIRVKADGHAAPSMMEFNGCASLKEVSLGSVTYDPKQESVFRTLFAGCPKLEIVNLPLVSSESGIPLPLGTPSPSVKFVLSDGVFDRNGRKVEE